MSKIDPNKLLISSDFYSVQGEGISSGVPSYFVRLGVCNLSCGVSRKMMNQITKEQKLEDGEIFTGDLHAEGKASWTCDSISQWAWRGQDKDFQYLIDRWKEQEILDDISKGHIHIIWTGGEPTIPAHQQAIINFTNYAIKQKAFLGFNYVDRKFKFTQDNQESEIERREIPIKNIAAPYYEIETNGTYYIEKELFYLLDQINCSPKLENSGHNKKQRIKPEAIERIMQHHNYQFKFVISTEEDVQEIFRDFIVPFDIPLQKVVCMPGMDKQEDFHERTQFVLEMAKKYKFRGLTRLHISAWNQVLNK
jgi:7-carboxy-7-deazaguanine synthase